MNYRNMLNKLTLLTITWSLDVNVLKQNFTPFFKMRTNEKYIYNGENIEIGDRCCV